MNTEMCALYAHKFHRIQMRNVLALIDILPGAHRKAVVAAFQARIKKVLRELQAEIVLESADPVLIRARRGELMQDGGDFRYDTLPSPYSPHTLILVKHPRGVTDAPITVDMGQGESITFPVGSDQNQVYLAEFEGFQNQLEHELQLNATMLHEFYLTRHKRPRIESCEAQSLLIL